MVKHWLLEYGIKSERMAAYLSLGIRLLIFALIVYVAINIASRLFNAILKKVRKRVSSNFVLYLIKYKATNTFFFFVVLLTIYRYAVTELFKDFPFFVEYGSRLAESYIVIVAIRLSSRIVTSIQKYMEDDEKYQGKPIASFAQLTKIALIIIGFIVIISILIEKSPIYLLGLLGGASVILVVAFKDTILGVVASIQLAYNDMVHIGDWISVDKYGADGDVIDIGLTTVKVQNWDDTITTFPIYALIADSFKNWQGMIESGSRRIKRSLHISATSIKFCSPQMLSHFRKNDLLVDKITLTEQKINTLHETHNNNTNDVFGNENMLTNISCFRAYIHHYLKNHPFINQQRACFVRVQEAAENGVPVEIYAFSKLQKLGEYDEVVSDIFEHIYAVIGYFELEVYQKPTSNDVRDER